MTSRRWPWRREAEEPGCSCGRLATDTGPVLVCPGCGAASDLVAPAIAAMTLRGGPQASACTACEQVTIVVEPDMVCQECQQLRPEINDRLRARFESHGPGDPAEAPCVGCGHYISRPDPPAPALDLIVDCQGCGDQVAIPEDTFAAGQGMKLRCGGCGGLTVIPRTVWCPHCGLHLRRLGIAELIRAANA